MRWRYYGTVVLTAMASVAVVSYGAYRLELRPASTHNVGHSFVVARGENAPLIAKHLEAAGLIRSAAAFVTYVNFHGLRSDIQAGAYSLSPSQSASEIATILAGGQVSHNRLVVPEGSTVAGITKLVVAHGIQASDFQAALAAPHSQSFLAGKPATVDLEGYLFPDSYQVDSTTTATALVNTMLDTFGQRVTDNYVAAFVAEGLTLHQGLTLASIVEREVATPSDRPIVAQIFLKRYRLGMPLGSDVTAQYASDLANVPFNVNIDSPYNTRKYAGLPPGPICSPGLSSLGAVAHPASTDYLYFLAGKDGKIYYAQTYAEHQANIAKHL